MVLCLYGSFIRADPKFFELGYLNSSNHEFVTWTVYPLSDYMWNLIVSYPRSKYFQSTLLTHFSYNKNKTEQGEFIQVCAECKNKRQFLLMPESGNFLYIKEKCYDTRESGD